MSSEHEREAGEPRRFSITEGPFLHTLHRLHLTRADGTPRAWELAAIAWGPLFLGALLRVTLGHEPSPILYDLSVHARLLIGIPLLIQAERLLEQRCRDAIGQLYRARLAERASLDRILDRAAHMRDSGLVELSLIAVVLLVGQAVVWGLRAPTSVFAGITEAGSVSLARIWYVAVALPLTQLLIMRWLWHWLIWSYIVVRLSRLPLATIATHPDHAAGLGFLGLPISAFAGFVLAIAATMSAAWATRILDGRATLESIVPTFAAFVILAVVIACGPLLLFAGMLYRARTRDLVRYHGLALDYVRAFDDRWIEARPDPGAVLGTPDLQSLNDLIGAYESLVRTRLVPISSRPIVTLGVAAVVPMLPLVVMTVPMEELLGHLGRVFLGGLPV